MKCNELPKECKFRSFFQVTRHVVVDGVAREEEVN